MKKEDVPAGFFDGPVIQRIPLTPETLDQFPFLKESPELRELLEKQVTAKARFKQLMDEEGLSAEAAAMGALAGGPEMPVEDVEEEGVWDAFRKEGMAKIANATLKEHGWMLVFNMAGETIPMRLPGPPRIACAEDLEPSDVDHLKRLEKLGVE